MIILDVREKEEFEAEHIPGSVLCPLSQISTVAPGILNHIPATEIVLMCRTGNRAELAQKELMKLGASHTYSIYEGGILKWKKEGKAVNGSGGVFPIMRQVQIFASSMIFIAFLLSHYVQHDFVYVALFVGFGLAMAGWTGFCPAAKVLQFMPWNKKSSAACSTDNSCCQ